MVAFSLVFVAVIVFLMGPRAKVELFWSHRTERVQTDKQFEDLTTADLRTLRDQIAQAELLVPDVVDGAEKHITFSSESRPKRTKFCVLYIHGYSACRQEISPVPENIAQALHANYYATRLTGHGIDGERLAAAKPSDWLFDLAEAWSVARQLGEKVIVISTSTGGTLTTWLAQQDDVKPHLAALIMVSPNFRPFHWAMPLFLWPWAKYWMPLIAGKTYGWEPANEGGAKYWTYRYPISAIHTMAATVKAVVKSDLTAIEAPTLFLYADEDKVVSARRTDAAVRRWGSKIKHRIAIPPKPADNNHVVTGDIVRPEATEQFTTDILAFLKQYIV
ncbi:MAG: alpha/beta fold hydrolase [Reinekea sp.]|nr:alpha/beta fold hydrolase [Reinekea sp.]